MARICRWAAFHNGH